MRPAFYPNVKLPSGAKSGGEGTEHVPGAVRSRALPPCGAFIVQKADTREEGGREKEGDPPDNHGNNSQEWNTCQIKGLERKYRGARVSGSPFKTPPRPSGVWPRISLGKSREKGRRRMAARLGDKADEESLINNVTCAYACGFEFPMRMRRFSFRPRAKKLECRSRGTLAGWNWRVESAYRASPRRSLWESPS
ncbi:hypothetical protein KM043_005647 [Ampulex compressa]|nr:hypothetical protein KM043_005647 [Ampulex compressa]